MVAAWRWEMEAGLVGPLGTPLPLRSKLYRSASGGSPTLPAGLSGSLGPKGCRGAADFIRALP